MKTGDKSLILVFIFLFSYKTNTEPTSKFNHDVTCGPTP